MTAPSGLVCVGAIAGAFGVRGEVRIKSFTAEPTAMFALGSLLNEDGGACLTVKRWRAIKDGFAAFAEQVATREQAEAMKSTRLYVPRERLPETDEDEFYHADLIGLAVKSLDGTPFGEVRAVQNYGAADLLEIWKTPGVRQPWMLPFTREIVPHVDLERAEVIIDPPQDMLPDGV